MAFTGAEKASIRMYCGWGGRWAQFDDALENAMNACEPDVDTATQIRGFLVELARIDTAITAAEGRLKASAVGSIDLNPLEVDQLRGRGRQFAARLCRVLGVESRGDPFDPTLPTDRASVHGMIHGGYQLQG